MAGQLDQEIDTGVDIFMESRPWLIDPEGERVIHDRSDELVIRKVENDFVIEEIVREIKYATNK